MPSHPGEDEEIEIEYVENPINGNPASNPIKRISVIIERLIDTARQIFKIFADGMSFLKDKIFSTKVDPSSGSSDSPVLVVIDDNSQSEPDDLAPPKQSLGATATSKDSELVANALWRPILSESTQNKKLES